MWSWAAPPYGNTPGSEVILRAVFADVFFKWVYNNNFQVIRWIEEGGRLAKPERCPERVRLFFFLSSEIKNF